MIGGAVTFVNPEPLAPFADVITAGEGESFVPIWSRRCAAAVRAVTCSEPDRQDRLYIPSFYTPRYDDAGRLAAMDPVEGTGAPPVVRKAAVKTTERLDPPHHAVHARHRVRVALPDRGRPRLRQPVPVLLGRLQLPAGAAVPDRSHPRACPRRQAYSSRAGLVSIALCDHPDIERILAGLAEMGYSISPASLRMDDLTPSIVTRLRESGERSLTIAPETGCDRLRRVINKTATNDEILERADVIFASGIENLKLYYMIGLPTETDEDLDSIRTLTMAMRERMLVHGRARGRLGRIVGSVNPLIPKPGTAYQWLPMEAIRRPIARSCGCAS